jgi:FtsH-binding integral membrane protein
MHEFSGTRVSPVSARAAARRVVGALSIYLNFINSFLILLRLPGGRRT